MNLIDFLLGELDVHRVRERLDVVDILDANNRENIG